MRFAGKMGQRREEGAEWNSIVVEADKRER